MTACSLSGKEGSVNLEIEFDTKYLGFGNIISLLGGYLQFVNSANKLR